jgi:hypothetical protein
MDSRIKRTAIAMAVATALALPGVSLAQATDKEKALEARVAELEKLVQEMMADKKAAPAPAPAAAAPAPAPAPTVATANKGSLTVKGFVIASLYAQDQNMSFGNGQNAEFATSEFSKDKWTVGGDVRNTRLTLDWKGPAGEGVNYGGLVEMDFFGGQAAGAFTDEQPLPRLRLAYVDLIKGDTTYRIGQMWSPMFGNVPVSPTHVAFPLGYGAAGDVGWRYPGLFVYHNFSKTTKLTLAAMRGSWNDASATFGQGAGESGFPQLEARLDFSGGPWSMYLVGHYDQKDCNLAGDTSANVCGTGYTKSSLDGTGLEFGAKAAFGAFSLQGNVYQGTAIGQQFGHITQFGDISGWGGWIQGSYKFTPTWSGNLFFGMDDPKDGDVYDSSPATGRVKNQQIAASVMYSSGPYVFGVEWLNNSLTRGVRATDGSVTETDVDANQLSFSAWYKF